MTASGNPGRLTNECGEQSQLALRLTFKLAERDRFMSEQKQSGFMQKLDLWVETNVFRPLLGPAPDEENPPAVEQQVKKAIREKILESYRNGQKAGPRSYPQQKGGR